MRILVREIAADYHYGISHILKLFYEDPEIHFAAEVIEAQQDFELELHFRMHEEENNVHVTATLMDQQGQSQQTHIHRPLGQSKRALHIALLGILTQYTGMDQPWGTLTGVRPLKLVHNRREQGMMTEQIYQELEEDYLIAPNKIALMNEIVDHQLQVVPDLYRLDREVSIYIGIPFCPTKCAYCTFPAYAIKGKQGSVDQFLAGLHAEIEAIGRWLQQHQVGVTSIYFGGGTPTSIEAHELDALFETIKRSFPNEGKSRELTVEAGRPDTITHDKIEVMKKWQVDRISINPQTFTQRTLNAIGRHHSVEEIIEKYQLAREMGLDNINMDLIIGLPGEGMTEYLDSLTQIELLRPESLTVHTLSYKSASAMTQNKEKYPVADRDTITQMVAHTTAWTQSQGYHPYYLYRQKNILGNQENVGYALPGKESIYNIMIMEEKQTIIGLGCGASSKILNPISKKITRYANPKEPKVYNEHYQDYIDGKLAVLNEELLGMSSKR